MHARIADFCVVGVRRQCVTLGDVIREAVMVIGTLHCQNGVWVFLNDDGNFRHDFLRRIDASLQFEQFLPLECGVNLIWALEMLLTFSVIHQHGLHLLSLGKYP